MAGTIHLRIISPERTVAEQTVQSVELPGALGRFVVLRDHAPLISSLVEGVISYSVGEDKEEKVAILSGFVEVADNQVTACVEL